MATKILLISNGFSFMANSIQKNLEKAQYEVIRIDPTVEELAEHRHEVNIFVFYLGKFVEDISNFLVYLRDVCLEEEKFLLAIGNGDEIENLTDAVHANTITATFERPVDFKKLTAEIDKLTQTIGAREAKKSILLVDDDPTFLKMMKGWLDYFYRVTIVTSGTQALMYLADNKPDLILLDYEMPVTSGPQVLGMIRSETNVDQVPVMFLTGKGDRESIVKVLALKPDGYLLKSLNREQILAAVKEFFEKKHAAEISAKSNS